MENYKILVLSIIFSALATTAAAENETNIKPAWLGEWIGYNPKTMKFNEDESISVIEFDGDLNFSSTPIYFYKEPTTRLEFLFNSSCNTTKTSKNYKKILISYNNCKNSDFNGLKMICEIFPNNPKDKSEIICNAVGDSKYFRRKTKN